MKVLGVFSLIALFTWLLWKAALLAALFLAFGLGIAVGCAFTIVGIDVIRKEEELQR